MADRLNMQTPSEVVARLFNWDISEETGRQGDKLAWDTFRDIAKEEYKKGALDTSYPWRKQDARKQQNVRNKTLDRLKTELNIEHQLSLMTDEIKVFALNWRLSKIPRKPPAPQPDEPASAAATQHSSGHSPHPQDEPRITVESLMTHPK